MSDVPHVPIVYGGILGIAVGVAVLIVALHRAARAGARAVALFAAGVVVWMSAWAAIAGSGVLADFDARPPPVMAVMLGTLLAGVALPLSSVGRTFAGLAPAVLVLSQAYRLPLELVMHHAATQGVMPVQLSWSGYNFDVVTGASALVLGLRGLYRPLPRAVLWAWNLYGIGALLVIVAIAIATSPVVRAFGDADINRWVAWFPYVWLPTVMVVGAMLGHGALTRRLLREAARTRGG